MQHTHTVATHRVLCRVCVRVQVRVRVRFFLNSRLRNRFGEVTQGYKLLKYYIKSPDPFSVIAFDCTCGDPDTQKANTRHNTARAHDMRA